MWSKRAGHVSELDSPAAEIMLSRGAKSDLSILLIMAVLGIIGLPIALAVACGVLASLGAFSPPPPGTQWFGGGGWSTVYMAAVLGAFVGFEYGLGIALVCGVTAILLAAARSLRKEKRQEPEEERRPGGGPN